MKDRVWLEFHTQLHAYVRRRVYSSAVEDVVAEILLRLVRSQVQMEGAKTPIAWMYRVAANVITDHYRRSASEKRLMEKAVLQGQIEDGPFVSDGGISEAGVADDNAASLAQCLVPMIKSLPAPYSQALILIDIEGIRQTDAARQLGLSVSGMKSRVQRGRQKLKTNLLQCCDIKTNQRGDIVDYKTRALSNCCT